MRIAAQAGAIGVICCRDGRCLFFGAADARRELTPLRPARACGKVVLTGEVNGGQEWKAAIGEGWVFRLVPIRAGVPAAAGTWWWIASRGAGYPDALLLATPPYNSINEREVGTTYGLRAQDAIGWNPRSFHFLTDPAALRQGQAAIRRAEQAEQSEPGQGSRAAADPKKGAAVAQLSGELMDLQAGSSAGSFAFSTQSWHRATPMRLHMPKTGHCNR